MATKRAALRALVGSALSYCVVVGLLPKEAADPAVATGVTVVLMASTSWVADKIGR